MAIRFSSFELYKEWLADPATGKVSTLSVFFGKFLFFQFFRWSGILNLFLAVIIAGLAAGTTEAVLVVSPMDLIKIRLQVNIYI